MTSTTSSQTLELKWKMLHSSATLPKYATPGAAGFDLTLACDQAIILIPGKVYALPTGLACEVPPGYELQIRARSGLALKYGLTLVNGVGTIDCDYRGEIKAIACLLSDVPLTLNPGDRICQGLVAPVVQVKHSEVQTLSDTERGAGGFGSTGVSK